MSIFLVITDHFIQYVQAIVTSLQTAKSTAQNLWDKFIVHYGLPEKILTDQGCNSESDLLKALCEIAQVKKIQTSGYHPQTNGQCKCFNMTLINMLGTLPEKLKSTWREQVPTLAHAYNCNRNNATEFSPYYLMFGQKPHLPINLIFGTNCYVRQCLPFAYLLLISLHEMCLGGLHYNSLYALSLHSALAHLQIPFSSGVSQNKRG